MNLYGMQAMQYKDLRDFIAQLERMGELKRIQTVVDPVLEMTEICDRVLRAGGPALLLRIPRRPRRPVLANLFSTTGWRWAWAKITSKPCAKSASCWRF